MAYDKQAIIDQLSGLTVLQLVELVDGLKETWGVEAAAAIPMGAMMAGPAAAGSGKPSACRPRAGTLRRWRGRRRKARGRCGC